MKSTVRTSLFVIVLAAVLLAACGAPATIQAPAEQLAAPAATAAPAMASNAQKEAVAVGAPPADSAGKAAEGARELDPNVAVETGANTTTLPDVQQPQTSHMIIKNADVKMQVEDTDNAIDRSMQIVGDVGGYIISSRVWYQDFNGENYKYATVSMGVPVDQFETAMRRLRGLAIKVLDENASGQDVTSEFVDLQSQLGNLEATRDRIRGFLNDAKTIEESLRINQELTNIEDQIEKVKGRMTFLSGRSAYSTITANIEPKLPELTPVPTPTRTPTPTPKVWDPSRTFDSTKDGVFSAYQGIVEMLIWLFGLLVVLAPWLLIVWAVWKFATRKNNKPASGG